MQPRTPFTLLVELSDQDTNESFTARVPMIVGLGASAGLRLGGAVLGAASQFCVYLMGNGREKDDVDHWGFRVERLSIEPVDDQPSESWNVEGAYTTGQPWGDSVEACSAEDAGLQARFVLANNEYNLGKTLTVQTFHDEGLGSLMAAMAIKSAAPEPTPRHTVLLMRPPTQRTEGFESDWIVREHVQGALSPEDAFGKAQDKAAGEHPGTEPGDYAPVAVYEGKLFDLLTS
jgi:hypothetical protein